MDVCGYAPDLRSSGGSWTAYHMSFRGLLYPFFVVGDDDTQIDDGFITTSSTGWVMHNSSQNFCYNVHYRGKCFKFSSLEPGTSSNYPDLPFWKLIYKHPWGFNMTKWINYPFPKMTGVDILDEQSGFDGVEPGWRKVHATFFAANVYIPVSHPDHPDWDCCIISCELKVAYVSNDSNSAGIGWLPSQDVIDVVDTRSTLDIYVFGKNTSSSSVGRVSGRYYLHPKTLELSFTPDMSSIKWWGASYPVVGTSGLISAQPIELPNYDDRLFFNPEKSFGLSFDWEKAMTAGLNQVNFFDSNGIAFAHDVASLPTTILSDVRNLRQFSKVDPSGKLKIAASTFLSVHYGYKLLAADGIELANELADYTTTHTLHIGQSLHPQAEVVTVGDRTIISAYGHLNVYYDPYAQLETEIGKFAEAVDLVPDFSNVWDMIPFSFVVDWFTNIGDLASNIDNYFTLTQQHKVLGSIRSRKVCYKYRPAGFFGSVQCTRYIRQPSEGWFPVPKYSFQFQNPVTNLYHWLEGAALVVSKIT